MQSSSNVLSFILTFVEFEAWVFDNHSVTIVLAEILILVTFGSKVSNDTLFNEKCSPFRNTHCTAASWHLSLGG